MSNLILALIGLAAIAFLLAVVAVLFTGPIMGVSPEGFSHACTNLALLAIALALVTRKGPTPG
jgi:hypothetical protein